MDDPGRPISVREDCPAVKGIKVSPGESESTEL